MFKKAMAIASIMGLIATRASAEGGGKGVMDIEVGLIFWTFVTFIVLLLLLRAFAWKPLMEVLKKREETIRDSIEGAKKAKEEGKPVFLSIGYSTCHWCHVMAHESFENERIAKILNEHFISIKVDREELPGIDAVYMDFVQKTTGSGGWPLSVFLTSDAKPFYGGTYFPPVDSYGRPGFETLLMSIEDAWRNRRDEILKSELLNVSALSTSSARKTS